MKKTVFSLTLTLLLSACKHIDQQDRVSVPLNTAPQIDQGLTEELKGVGYRDAVADVNLAIERRDFQLIALVNGQQSIPGINTSEMNMHQIKQDCGLRFASEAETDTTASDYNLIKQYATEYNRLMWQACQRKAH